MPTTVDHNDLLASTSNRGAANVDLSAPGVGILSTLPRNSYGSKNGTSMASPHVAGVAALAMAYRPGADAAQVRAAILTGVDRVPSLAGVVATGGRLNAFGTLARIDAGYADPQTPVGLEVSSVTTGAISLAWQSNNDPDVEGYNVYRSTDGGPLVLVAKLSAGSTTFQNVSLLPGTNYAYQITARNYLSVESEASSTVQATTLGDPIYVPAAPTNLTATSASRTQINLAWTDNSGDEMSFIVERSTDGATWAQVGSVGANVTAYADPNLKRNVRYYYRVRASNQAGQSPYSNVASAVTGGSAAALPGAAPASANVFSIPPIALLPLDGEDVRPADAVLA